MRIPSKDVRIVERLLCGQPSRDGEVEFMSAYFVGVLTFLGIAYLLTLLGVIGAV